ncbi:MAG: hypothetical protein ACPKM0_02615 [Pleomorphochaeta sp.]
MNKKVLLLSILLLFTSATGSIFAESSIAVGPFVDNYTGMTISELSEFVTLQDEDAEFSEVLELLFVPHWGTMAGVEAVYKNGLFQLDSSLFTFMLDPSILGANLLAGINLDMGKVDLGLTAGVLYFVGAEYYYRCNTNLDIDLGKVVLRSSLCAISDNDMLADFEEIDYDVILGLGCLFKL